MNLRFMSLPDKVRVLRVSSISPSISISIGGAGGRGGYQIIKKLSKAMAKICSAMRLDEMMPFDPIALVHILGLAEQEAWRP